MIKTKSVRCSNPTCVGGEITWDFSDRATAFQSIIQVWYDRRKLFKTRKELDRSIARLVAIPGSPGMGKSTMLDVLASGAGSSTILRQTKEKLFGCLKSGKLLQEFLEFCDQISNAMAVSVTFNSGSPRAADEDLISDPQHAMSVRLLWSHFCPAVPYKQFAKIFTAFNRPSFSYNVTELLLAEAGDRDIILCVDELMYVDSIPGPRNEVTKGVSDILGLLGTYCDKESRIHTVVSSLCAKPLSHYNTISGRVVQFVKLPRLSDASCIKIAESQVPTSWLSTECVSEACGGVGGDVARQLVRDTAGGPRLLQFVIESLRGADVKEPTAIMLSIWEFMGKLQCLAGIDLLDALKKALSGEQYRGDDIDVYCGCGLFIQSNGSQDMDYPCIPPILLKLLYKYAREQLRLKENSMERQLLFSCQVFLSLDTYVMPTAPYFFEKQVAHLFRIRLLLQIAEGHNNFSLQDLIGTPEFLWQKDGARTYPLDKSSLLPVHQLSQEQLEYHISQPSTGAFYFPRDPNFPAVDFILHLVDNTLILVQVKFSKEDASTCVSTGDVAKCLSVLTAKHKFLCNKKIVFVYFALREGRQNFSLDKVGVADKVPPGCMEMAVLFNKHARSILPYSLSLRPHLS